MRVDLLLVERGLVPSRERARALILAGRVLVGEQKVEKAGATVPADAPIRLLGEDQPYVSRGGFKLAAALAHWQIAVQGRACLDVGASTGGFTDCLLQAGAAQVTAVDTGFGQIAMKLRNDPRVRLLERTNARLLEPGALKAGQGSADLTLLVMDVSFISATLLLEPVFAAAPVAHRSRHPGQAAVRGRARTRRQGRHRPRSRGAPTRHRQGSRLPSLAGLAGRRNHSLAHHRRGGQPRVPALRAAGINPIKPQLRLQAELRKKQYTLMSADHGERLGSLGIGAIFVRSRLAVQAPRTQAHIKPPTMGTKAIRSHQPLLPVS